MSLAGEDTFDLTCEAQRFPIAANRLTIRRTEDLHLRHEVVSNPSKDRHERLLAELMRLEVDPEISASNATHLLRAAGVTVGKGRIPTSTWEAYKALPKPFTIAQGAR